MGSRMEVRGPLALYWLMTIMVAAGAVAVAMAPRIRQVDTGSTSLPTIKWSRNNPTSTKSVAVSAWKMAMTVA